jgi:FkbM family methyltransferase
MNGWSRIEVATPPKRGIAPLPFWTRPGTSDEKAIEETVTRNTYLKRGVLVLPGSRWLDLGANVGGFSKLVMASGAARVDSYEAAPTNIDILRANVAEYRGRAFVHHAAIVADDYPEEFVTLHLGQKPLQQRRHSILKARRGSVGVQVPVVRFGTIALNANIKLNIEGVEIPVLTKLERPLFHQLACEWSFDIDPKIATLAAVVEKLRGWYSRVELSRKIDWSLDEWKWFPPNVFIYASGRRAPP